MDETNTTDGIVSTAVDRRPLAVRDRPVFVRSASLLAATGMTPNMISALGLVMGGVLTAGRRIMRAARYLQGVEP